jgi:hypothetical protein
LSAFYQCNDQLHYDEMSATQKLIAATSLASGILLAVLAITPGLKPPHTNSKALRIKNTLIEERSPETVFQKAIAYLCSQQEVDGCWSSARSEAAQTFRTINGDIALTAVVTSALLDACATKQKMLEAQKSAKRGLEWLTKLIRADGGIADEAAGGEPVAAQLWAALALLQAGELSSREATTENAAKLCRYAIANLQSNRGGFGATRQSGTVRADLTALAALMFEQARAASVSLSGSDNATVEQDCARKFERSIRYGIAALNCKSGAATLAWSSDKLEPDWDATVCGLLGDVTQMVQGEETQARLRFMMGTDSDPALAGVFPGIDQHVKWDRKGEGVSGLSLFFGSLVVTRVYSLNLPVRVAWRKSVISWLATHQLPDGGWEAGENLGRYFRAALAVRALKLLGGN